MQVLIKDLLEVLPRRDAEPAVRRASISSDVAHEVVSDLESAIQAADGTVEIGVAADRRRRPSRRCASCSRT